jgi:ribose-phosphate pyrophosphokinase
LKNLVVVSPDVGGLKMARAYSKVLNASLAIVDKRRESDRQTHVMHIIGSVKNRNVLLVDDLISTGGSLVEAIHALKKEGALDVYAGVVHAVLADPAVRRIQESGLKELVVTNSIPIPRAKQIPEIRVLSVAKLLAQAIERIHSNESVSSLFARVGVEA